MIPRRQGNRGIMIPSRKSESHDRGHLPWLCYARREVRSVAKGKYEQWLTPEGLGCIEAWCRDGLTDEELARKMGISSSTLYAWRQNHSEISEAATRGRGGAREQIENSVYKKARGYTVTVKEPMKLRSRMFNEEKGKFEEREEVVQVEREIYIQPDMKAASLWLTNRNRDRWAEHPTPQEGEQEKVTVICDV